MPDQQETIDQLHCERAESRYKYTYFLLGAAAAAIAFAVNQTAMKVVSCSQIPLALAVACWGWSFYAGCRRVQIEDGVYPKNIRVIELSNAPPDAAEIVCHSHIKLNEEQAKAEQMGDWQFRSLVAGGVFYVAWHVGEMILRTNS